MITIRIKGLDIINRLIKVYNKDIKTKKLYKK